MTKQRQLILNIIRDNMEHLSADDIYMLVKKESSSMVYATVYNSLNYLADNKYIRRIRLSNQADRFDRNLLPHDHFVCEKCGIVKDVPSHKDIEKCDFYNGNIINSYEMVYYGICEECLKKDHINKTLSV